MGRSKRRRRTEREALEPGRSSRRKGRRAEDEGTYGVPVSHEAGLPDVFGVDRHFWKFALAFLIIFVLLWLLAPEDP